MFVWFSSCFVVVVCLCFPSLLKLELNYANTIVHIDWTCQNISRLQKEKGGVGEMGSIRGPYPILPLPLDPTLSPTPPVTLFFKLDALLRILLHSLLPSQHTIHVFYSNLPIYLRKWDHRRHSHHCICIQTIQPCSHKWHGVRSCLGEPRTRQNLQLITNHC